MTTTNQAQLGTVAPKGAEGESEYPKTRICKYEGCKKTFVIERKNPGTERLFCSKACRQAQDRENLIKIREAGRAALQQQQQQMSA